MTPRQLRDSANRPWEDDEPRTFYLPAGTYTPEEARAAYLPVRRRPQPGEYHFPADCPGRKLGILIAHCSYCLVR